MAAADPGRLLLLLDRSLDFIEIIGADGVIRGVTAAITALGGYDPGELVGRNYKQILHPDDWSHAVAAFTRVVENDCAEPITVRYRHKNGSWRTVLATARNFLDDPAVRAIVVLTRDITEQLDANAQLAEANRELHRLSQRLLAVQEAERSHIARELHDDVQQILVGLRLGMHPPPHAGAAYPGPELLDDWRNLVQRAIEHLHRLTANMRPPVLDEHGLASQLRAHVGHLRHGVEQRIFLDIGTDLGRLNGDVELASFRIVQEAIANAIHHSGTKHIRVRVRRTAALLTLAVLDDGCGFDTVGARAANLRDGKIGIASMQERAALVGGELRIESRRRGGTCVSARIPIAPG